MNSKSDMLLPVNARTVWRSATVLVLLTLGLAALAFSDSAHDALKDMLEASHSIITGHPVAGPLLFVGLAAITAMVAFVSVAALLPMAVFTWGEGVSILLLWAGWLLGGACTYLAGRFLGRLLLRWLGAGSLLQRLELHLGPSTSFGVVLLLQMALPSEIPGYVLGLVRYSAPKYLLALAIVELIYTMAAVHLGASFVERRAGTVLATGIAIATFSVMAFYVLRKKL